MAAANQPATGRPSWLLRLASQARIDPPQQAPQPQPQPQPQPSSPAVRPTAPPPPPPRRGPPIRQASLALGRPPLVVLPASTAQPPPAALSQTAPPPASTNGAAVTALTEAPRAARAPSPALPPPPPAASTNGSVIYGTRAASAAPPPPSPRTTARSSWTPPESPRVVLPVNSSSSPGFGYSNPQPERKPAAIAAGKDSRDGNKDLGNGAFNASDSFKQHNTTLTLTKTEKETAGITISGHNVGAFMYLGASHSHQIRRQQYQHVNGKPQFEDINKSNATATEFEAEGGDGRKQKPWFSMVNSNVQSVNNSMLLNTECVQGSPGVHISVGRGRSLHPLKNGGNFSDQKKPSSSRSSSR